MKRKRSKTMMAIATGAALMAAAPIAAQAQGITEIVGKADGFVRKGDWVNAHATYKQATEMYPEARANKLFGPGPMGYLWYRRGLSGSQVAKLYARSTKKEDIEQAKKLYENAVKAFEKSAKIGADIRQNKFKNVSMYRIGKCKQSLKDYKGALQAYAKFIGKLNARNPAEKAVNFGQFRLDRAICYLKLENPNLSAGQVDLEWVMQPQIKAKFKIPDAAIVSAFQAYSQSVCGLVEDAKDNETKKKKLEDTLVGFMNKNRGTLTLPPYQMYTYTPHFLKLAFEVRELGMHKALFAMMSFLPNTTTSKEDMEEKVVALGGRKFMIDNYDRVESEFITKDLTLLINHTKKGKPHEMTQNLLMASYFEEEGNVRAAFAIYEMIELYHSNAPEREEWLYNLVRTANNIGEIHKTREYGQRFLKDFPKSDKRADVEKFMLISLFRNGRYEDCIEVAKKILPSLQENTKQHDVALFCLGGSHFYLGQSVEASELLAKHVKMYGKGTAQESAHAVSAQYFDAANETYVGRWEQAAEKLDKFLKDYPKPEENAFYPLAKFDRANCHYQAEGEEEQSLECLKIVIDKFPECPIIDRAYTLRGNNLDSLSKTAEARVAFETALGLAQRARNEDNEAEILNYLVAMLGSSEQKGGSAEEKALRNQNYAAAVKYYDMFWEKYSDTHYKTDVAVSGLTALRSVDRGKFGLGNLKQVIMQLAAVDGAPGMDKAINTYTDEYLKEKGNTALMLKEHYTTEFKFRGTQVYAQSLVKMSLVDAYGALKDQAKKDNDDAAEKRWNTAIKTELQELATLPLDKLNNYTLVTIGNSIRKAAEEANNKNQMAGASVFYETAIANSDSGKDGSYINEATFGYAAVLATTKDSAKMAKAYASLEKLKNGKKSDKKVKESAHYYMITIAHGQKKYDKVVELTNAFFKEYRRSRFRGLARVSLADSYYKQDKLDEASECYGQLIQSNIGALSVSAPAMLKIMDIAEEQGKRYESWRAGSDYLRITKKMFEANKHKITDFERSSWEKIEERVEDLKTEPDVAEKIEEQEEIDRARREIHGN